MVHRVKKKFVSGQDFTDLADAADLSDADIVRLSGLSMPEVFRIYEGESGARLSDLIIINFLAAYPQFKDEFLRIAAENTEETIHTSSARQERRAHLQGEI